LGKTTTRTSRYALIFPRGDDSPVTANRVDVTADTDIVVLSWMNGS
jgi:hypothetical protein